MDQAMMPLMQGMSIIEGVLQLLLALIPLAIWQRTRLGGFALVAAGFALGGALQFLWVVQYFIGGGLPMVFMLGLRLLGFLALVLTAAGFWQIYGAYRQPKPATPAGG